MAISKMETTSRKNDMQLIIRTSQDRDAAVQAVRAIRSEPLMQVTITEHKKTRRDRQNKYYWGVVLRHISDHTGDDVNSLHEYFKHQFLEGEKVLVLGQEVMLYPSTAKLNVQAFTKYLDSVTLFAFHELQVVMPVMEE